VEYQYDPDMGARLDSNQRDVIFARSCVVNDRIRTNSMGFRDDDWATDEQGLRIAVLGDSFMEALHVPDGEILADILETRFNGDVDVLNFGITGYGTLHEFLVFKKYAKRYNPDFVLLFFVTNDIADNFGVLQRIVTSKRRHLAYGYVQNGEVFFSKPEPLVERSFVTKKLKLMIKGYCKSCLTLKRLFQQFARTVGKKPRKGFPIDWHVYMTPTDTLWIDAWHITEHFLVKLHEEVKASGSELVVFTVPDYLRVCDDWEGEVEKYTGASIPAGFDPFYPIKKLQEIAMVHDITMVELEPYYISYKKDHDLAYPYFYFECDGHLNTLGHRVTADAVYEVMLGFISDLP